MIEQALGEIEREFQKQSPPLSQPQSPSTADRLGHMLAALEQETSAKKLETSLKNKQICQTIDALIQQKRQQQQLELDSITAIAEQEKIKQEREKYWPRRAAAWLEELDPLSNEGLWFSEFSDNYDSPLEAAIDYLMALE